MIEKIPRPLGGVFFCARTGIYDYDLDMKYLLSLALLLGSLSIHAEIYRGVDDEGNVFYSDKEQPNSELIPTPTSNTIPMPKLEAKQPVTTEEKKDSPYKSFSIVSPSNSATIRDNTGNLSVSLSIEPILNIKNGDYFRLSIDNRVVTARTTSLTTQIPNIDRGSHSLKAELVDSSGQTIMSNSVQFHMKRFSILH